MLYIITVLIFSVLFFVWWCFVKPPGLSRYQSDIEPIVVEFFSRACSGGFLILTHEKTKYFLQLYKYKEDATAGIVLSIPIVKWNQKYITKIIEYFESNHIVYETLPADGSDALDFIDVDFITDTEKATQVVKIILNDIFKVPKEDSIYVCLRTKG